MPAFNSRLKPKEIFGMPMLAMVGLTMTLIFGVLSLLLPSYGKFFTVPLAAGGLVLAAAAFWFGEELRWVHEVWLGLVVHPNRVTSEMGEEKNDKTIR